MRRQGFPWRQTTVAKTEAASRPLRVDELVALAQILNVDIKDMLNPTITSEEELLRGRLTDLRAALDKTEKAREVAQQIYDNVTADLVSYEEEERKYQEAIADCMTRLSWLRSREADVSDE
jgi:transcriptional regulator with XRE-family HTH domain